MPMRLDWLLRELLSLSALVGFFGWLLLVLT